MKKEFHITRRDFLKLGGVGAAILGGQALSACSRVLEPQVEEMRLVGFDPFNFIYNGKAMNYSDLSSLGIEGIEIAAFYNSIVLRIKEIILDSQKPKNPEGYEGASFPEDYELSFGDILINIVKDKEGDYVAYAYIGRRKKGEDFSDNWQTAFNYNNHSLLVMGRGDKEWWFDNVESVNKRGEKVRIVVDGKNGKIYQIRYNNPNLLYRWFKNEETTMEVSEIDIFKGKKETGFTFVFTPFSEGFFLFLKDLIETIKKIKQDVSQDEIKNYVYQIFLEGKLKGLTNLLNEQIDDETSDFLLRAISIIENFRLDIPFNGKELNFLAGVLAKSILKVVEGNDFGKNFSFKIRDILPTRNKKARQVEERLLKERIRLPMTTPEIYFIESNESNESNGEWYMVAHYPVWENDVDRTVWTTLPNGFDVQTSGFWYTLGKVDSEFVNNEAFLGLREEVGLNSSSRKLLSEILYQDRNPNEPLKEKTIGSVIKLKPAAIKYIYDPSDSNKINCGFFIEDNYGNLRAVEIRLDSLGRNLHELPIVSSRWLPLVGDSPRIVRDVTKQVQEMIMRGQIDTSLFDLDPLAIYSLLAGIADRSLVDYTQLPQDLKDALITPNKKNWNVDANNVIFLPVGTEIHTYDQDGKWLRSETLKRPIIISPRKISQYEGGYEDIIPIVIAEAKGKKYVVNYYLNNDESQQPNPLFLGSRTDASLYAMALGELAGTIALMYGGYTAIKNPQLVKSFLKQVLELVIEKIPLFNQ